MIKIIFLFSCQIHVMPPFEILEIFSLFHANYMLCQRRFAFENVGLFSKLGLKPVWPRIGSEFLTDYKKGFRTEPN